MSHKRRHKSIKRAKRKFRHLAAAVAGAAILSSGMLPGVPAATVHAASAPDPAKPAAEVTQQLTQKQLNNNYKPAKKTYTGKAAQRVHAESGLMNKPSAQKGPTDYRKVIHAVATAYAPGPHDNDQWGSKTHLGTEIRPGVIAVDPNVIPLGSRVYIEYPDGHGNYAVAEDTGGAIKGNRIDVATTSVDKAYDFGMKDVKVYVLNGKEKA